MALMLLSCNTIDIRDAISKYCKSARRRLTRRNEDLKNGYATIPGKVDTFKVDVQRRWRSRLPVEGIHESGNLGRCVRSWLRAGPWYLVPRGIEPRCTCATQVFQIPLAPQEGRVKSGFYSRSSYPQSLRCQRRPTQPARHPVLRPSLLSWTSDGCACTIHDVIGHRKCRKPHLSHLGASFW